MALEVKELDCPNCGASLSAKNAHRAKVLVCHNCGSQIDLTSPEHAIMGQAILGGAPPKSPIRLGQVATFDGIRWMVVGRVRYRDRAQWDEWLLMSEAGNYQWLVESDDEFTLYQPFVPTSPVDPNTAGKSIDLEGIAARVKEKGRATIKYLEGELTWKARVGDKMSYLDAKHADGVYSIEWTEREIEFFKGQRISQSAVYKAFGFKRPRKARKRKEVSPSTTDEPAPASDLGRRFAAIWVVVILIIVFVGLSLGCLMCGCLPAGTGQGVPGSSTWTTPAPGSLWSTPTPWTGSPPSVRIGSPEGGGTSGGFGGGK